MNALRERLWTILEPATEGDTLSKWCDVFLITLILTNVFAAVIETVEWIANRWGWALSLFEHFSVSIFAVEYLLRLWSCRANPQYDSLIWGRVRFAMTPLALIDLLAILPAFLPASHIDLRMLRLLRMFRLLRSIKLARYTAAVDIFVAVFREKKEEIVVAFCVMFLLVLFSAAIVYYVENPAQPDKFPDIRTAMWWAVITLATVGYGDVYPVTGPGKFVTGIVALLGIGMFALPAGILGAGFTEEIQRRRRKKTPSRCPHCGQALIDF